MFRRCFLFIYFNDFCQTNKIYPTDIRQIFRVARTLTVNDQSENSFPMIQGTLPWQSISVGFIYRTDFRHANG